MTGTPLSVASAVVDPVGPGAAGALLNEDRRPAVEIIAEARTGDRDPENRGGTTDDLDSAGPFAH